MEYKKLTRLIFALIFLSLSLPVKANQIKNLTILAEPNMVNALTKIARIYSQKNKFNLLIFCRMHTKSDGIGDDSF